jgi:hypothetical protein
MSLKPTLLPPELQLLVAWEHALDILVAAARDTAEFEHGKPTGRSRQASIRRLADALRSIDSLASSNTH